MVLKELISNQFLLWEGVVVLKELILTVSTVGQGVVVFKELISNQLIIWKGVVVLKELILTVSTLGIWWSLKN